MKTLKITALLSLTALLATGCNKENLNERQDGGQEPQSEISVPQPCRIGQVEIDGVLMNHTPAEMTPEMMLMTKADREYVIPVVFHVFGKRQNGATITDKVIEESLEWVNNDFHGVDNPNDPHKWGRVHADRKEFAQPMPNITFKLAKFDPDGKPTTGIVYYPETHAANRQGLGNYSNSAMPNIAWNNKKYMNVYITADLYADGVTNNSGVSWYPDIYMTNANIARVVYNGAYLPGITKYQAKDPGVVTGYGPDFGSVLTHEFGHFMNLHHTFNETPQNYSYTPTDYDCKPNLKDGGVYGDSVEDTPQMQMSSNYPAYAGYNKKNCVGELIDFGNFMNYGVYCNFTKGQVERMTAALNHNARRTLWSEKNLKETLGEDAEPEPPVVDPDDPSEPSDNSNIDNIRNGNTVVITDNNPLFPAIAANTSLAIYNAKGQMVYESSNYDGTFDMSGLQAGSYYYTITGNGQTSKGSVEVI